MGREAPEAQPGVPKRPSPITTKHPPTTTQTPPRLYSDLAQDAPSRPVLPTCKLLTPLHIQLRGQSATPTPQPSESLGKAVLRTVVHL